MNLKFKLAILLFRYIHIKKRHHLEKNTSVGSSSYINVGDTCSGARGAQDRIMYYCIRAVTSGDQAGVHKARGYTQRGTNLYKEYR